MNCSKIIDMIYDHSGPMPLLVQIQIWLHAFVCPHCARELERHEAARAILREDFFPYSPGVENSIINKLEAEENLYNTKDDYVQAGFSTRGWVIAGLVIFISLTTAFLGLDFKQVTNETGLSFLLPMGILTGIVVTTYGVLFISSHLKELTERFGL